MAEVEVRQGPNGLEHKHDGYPGWHPVSQKHKNGLHEALGITGKEKPTRDRSQTGVKMPNNPAPKKPKQVGTSHKPDIVGLYSSPGDFFKAYAKARPNSNNVAGNIFFNAMNAMFAIYNAVKNKVDAKDAKAVDEGFYNALANFDEVIPFRPGEDLNKLSVSELRRMDASLSKLFMEKYKEYGGKELMGRTDRDALAKKAELKAYTQMIDKFRKQSEHMKSRHNPRRQSSGKTPTAGELR